MMSNQYIKLVNGIEVPMSQQEIEQRQKEEMSHLPLGPSLNDILNLVFSELPPEQQADLAPLKAAVKLELDQNRPEIARLIIERATIPPALENSRQAMLLLFQQGKQTGIGG